MNLECLKWEWEWENIDWYFLFTLSLVRLFTIPTKWNSYFKFHKYLMFFFFYFCWLFFLADGKKIFWDSQPAKENERQIQKWKNQKNQKGIEIKSSWNFLRKSWKRKVDKKKFKKNFSRIFFNFFISVKYFKNLVRFLSSKSLKENTQKTTTLFHLTFEIQGNKEKNNVGDKFLTVFLFITKSKISLRNFQLLSYQSYFQQRKWSKSFQCLI